MKKTILILAILLLVGADAAMSQLKVQSMSKDLTVMTKRGKTGTALTDNLGDGSSTFYWKIWASPKYWSPIDTTTAFNMSELAAVGDTIVVPFVASDATTPYNAAIYIQWGNGAHANGPTVWKPAVFLDSIVRIGTALAPPTPATGDDSVFVGRNVHHDWLASGKGSDRFRLLIRKDTTDAADANPGTTNGTATYRVGVIRRVYTGKL